MSEVDPDPQVPVEQPGSGDPTDGGRRGQLGEAPSIAADEPAVGSYPVGGGNVTEEPDAAPDSAPGRDA